MCYGERKNGLTTTNLFYIPVDSDLNADDVVVRAYINIIHNNKVIIVDDVFWVFKKSDGSSAKAINDKVYNGEKMCKLFNLLDRLNEQQINLMYRKYDDDAYQNFKIINYLEDITKDK